VPADKGDGSNDITLVLIDPPFGPPPQNELLWDNSMFTNVVNSVVMCNSLQNFVVITFTTLTHVGDLMKLLPSTPTTTWDHIPGVWSWTPCPTSNAGLCNNQLALLTSICGDRQRVRMYPVSAPAPNGSGSVQSTSLFYPRPAFLTTMKETKEEIINTQERPVELYCHLIRRFSGLGDTILDIGSGSRAAAEAAFITGRNVICVEKDARQYRGIIQRLRTVVASVVDDTDDEPVPDKSQVGDSQAPPADGTSGETVPADDYDKHACVVCGNLEDPAVGEIVKCAKCTGNVHERCGEEDASGKVVCASSCSGVPDSIDSAPAQTQSG
jgi:hypothetical protein